MSSVEIFKIEAPTREDIERFAMDDIAMAMNLREYRRGSFDDYEAMLRNALRYYVVENRDLRDHIMKHHEVCPSPQILRIGEVRE